MGPRCSAEVRGRGLGIEQGWGVGPTFAPAVHETERVQLQARVQEPQEVRQVQHGGDLHDSVVPVVRVVLRRGGVRVTKPRYVVL